jgi:hypothetical protein
MGESYKKNLKKLNERQLRLLLERITETVVDKKKFDGIESEAVNTAYKLDRIEGLLIDNGVLEKRN